MPVSKDRCQLCAVEKNYQRIVDAAKGNLSQAFVSATIAGIVGHVANPDLHKECCEKHVVQMSVAAIQAIGMLAERAMAKKEEFDKNFPESPPEPPPRGNNVN